MHALAEERRLQHHNVALGDLHEKSRASRLRLQRVECTKLHVLSNSMTMIEGRHEI